MVGLYVTIYTLTSNLGREPITVLQNPGPKGGITRKYQEEKKNENRQILQS
nr:MAG TPA: hypothetical protein [Caudoviricetes sp.]DAN97996.1 MAG TPA: hypothetical protein [Caudoviricetes sp.]